MRTQAQIDQVLNDVRAALSASRQSTGIDLEVPPDGYLEDGNWLSVVVTPADPDVRVHQYVSALSTVEKTLRARGIQEVLLVPAIAD